MIQWGQGWSSRELLKTREFISLSLNRHLFNTQILAITPTFGHTITVNGITNSGCPRRKRCPEDYEVAAVHVSV